MGFRYTGESPISDGSSFKMIIAKLNFNDSNTLLEEINDCHSFDLVTWNGFDGNMAAAFITYLNEKSIKIDFRQEIFLDVFVISALTTE